MTASAPADDLPVVTRLRVHTTPIRSLSILDGKLLSRSNEYAMSTWDPTTGTSTFVDETESTFVPETRVPHTASIRWIGTSPDGRALGWFRDEEAVKLYDIEASTCLQTFPCPSLHVTRATFLPDDLIAIGDQSGTVTLWNTGSALPVLTLRPALPPSSVLALAALPNRRIAVSTADNTLCVYDTTSGLPLHTIHAEVPMTSLVGLPDGRRLASASNQDTVVWVWDVTPDYSG